MYLYLYDSFLTSAKHQKTIDRIESRLTDLGISGRVTRLTIIENAVEIVKDALRKNIQTVVVVGRDTLLCETAVALVNQPVVLGFIPIGLSKLGKILGIPPDEFGCDVLSARRIKSVDVGKINNQYFFSSLFVQGQGVDIECEGSYKINLVSVKDLRVTNLDFLNQSENGEPKSSNPFDGLLEASFLVKKRSFLPFIKKGEYQDSIFYVKRISISSAREKEISILVDEEKILKTPAGIEIIPEAVKIIVGKDRLV